MKTKRFSADKYKFFEKLTRLFLKLDDPSFQLVLDYVILFDKAEEVGQLAGTGRTKWGQEPCPDQERKLIPIRRCSFKRRT